MVDEVYVMCFIRFDPRGLIFVKNSFEINWIGATSAIVITEQENYKLWRSLLWNNNAMHLTEIQLIKRKR